MQIRKDLQKTEGKSSDFCLVTKASTKDRVNLSMQIRQDLQNTELEAEINVL